MSQDEGGEERIRVHGVESYMRVETWGTPPRLHRSQVWQVMPWARGFDEPRYQKLLRLEMKFPHPDAGNADEVKVQASSPQVDFFELVMNPHRGVEHRLFLGRN